MKKLLLIAGIFSFFFASAQRNPFIVPQKPWLKKYTPSYWENKLKDSLSALRWKKGLNDTQFLNHFTTHHAPQAKFQFILPNSTKIYSLPLDNMVCIVPNLSQFNMPNAGVPKLPSVIIQELKDQLEHQPGKIPNAVTPYDIIPQRKDTPTQ